MIEKIFVPGPAPDWCQERIDKGMAIHVAARPLWGSEVDDSWSMPSIRGRHYAALDPADDRFNFWTEENKGLDGREVVYVDKRAALQAAYNHYQATAFLRRMLADTGVKSVEDMAESEYEQHFLETGLDALNGGVVQ